MASSISATPPDAARRHGMAWLALVLAIGLHVADEAMTGFLSLYNPTVAAIRRRLPFMPLPVFTFGSWLLGLGVGIAVLLALSPLVFRGRRWTVPVSQLLSVLMLFNAALHLGASVYLRRPAPGLYSAPVLAAASLFLLYSASKRR